MLHGHSHNTAVAAEEEEVKSLYRAKGIPCSAYNAGCMYFGNTPDTLDEIICYWKKDR